VIVSVLKDRPVVAVTRIQQPLAAVVLGMERQLLVAVLHPLWVTFGAVLVLGESWTTLVLFFVPTVPC